MTLLSITNLSLPNPQIIQLKDLLYSLDKFFTNDQQTVTATLFTDYISGLISSGRLWVGTQENLLCSLVTLPLLLFHINGLGSLGSLIPTPLDVPAPNLPQELYNTAQLARSSTRIIISMWTVIVFTALGSAIYLWCLAWLGWAMTIQGPKLSQFPLIDFSSRIAAGKSSAVGEITPLAAGSGIRSRLEDVCLYLGEINETEEEGIRKVDGNESHNIGFSTTDDVRSLKRGIVYS